MCVVGAGAAGLTLARELGRRHREVVLLEAGSLVPEEATQALHELESVGQHVRAEFMSRARYFGGTCNLWAGRSMRLGALDLERRSWVEGSGWPLGFDELAEWIEAAGELLGLPSSASFEPSRHRDRLSESERRLYDDSPFRPTVSLWAKRPMRFGGRFRRELVRSDRVRLVLNANATEVLLEPAGRRARGVRARTLAGGELVVEAPHVVLACGGIENARLLLASRDVHPCGVGNQHDLVGRFFMDHPRAVHGRIELSPEADLPHLMGMPMRDGKVQLGIGLDPELQRRERLLNHYATFEAEYSDYARAGYGGAVRLAKILLRKGYAGSRLATSPRLAQVPELIYLFTPKELLPHGLWAAASRARRALRRGSGSRRRIVVYYCEQPPRSESRITLGEERDALGVPRPVLDWRLGDEVTRSLLRLEELLKEELAGRGIGVLEPGEGEPRYTDASHHMGTTRMALRPEEGVVDTDCRVHGVENLHLASSSVFPCAGHANPTLTIVALALRLAEHLAAERGGEGAG